MTATPYEDLVMLERDQQEAALRIQNAYRRFRNLRLWREYLFKTKMATQIQVQ